MDPIITDDAQIVQLRRRVAELVRQGDWPGAPPVVFSIVWQETMYHSDNQKLLFPVT